MVAELSETVTPVGLATLNATGDPNPFRRFRLIAEVPCSPVLIERLDGFADRPKSRNVNVVVAVRAKRPLVPVTATLEPHADAHELEIAAVPLSGNLVGA